jgi:xylulokinase
MSLLGVDIGTSSCKCVAFGFEGDIVAKAVVPHEGRDKYKEELDSEMLWLSFVKAVNETVKDVRVGHVDALAISSHGETIIPLDANLKPAYRALLNSDNRSSESITLWERKFGWDRIYEITGLPLHSMYSLPKLRWYRYNLPEQFVRTCKYMPVTSYILHRLGFPPAVDPTIASRTMGMDLRTRTWNEPFFEYAGVKPFQFCEIVPTGTAMGKLGVAAAGVLKCSEDTVVCIGGHDQVIGNLGAGGNKIGLTVDSAGSYECLTTVTGTPSVVEDAKKYFINVGPYLTGDKYVAMAFFTSGLVIDWFLNGFFREDSAQVPRAKGSVFKMLEKKHSGREYVPTNIIATPHLIGAQNPNWNPDAEMLLYGMGVTSDRYVLYKAILEGLACELERNISAIEETIEPVTKIHIYGGSASSDLLMGLRSSITGKNFIRFTDTEAVCRGTAILAGIGTGIFDDYNDSFPSSFGTGDEFESDKNIFDRYAFQKSKYRKLVAAVTERVTKSKRWE